jgi:hypothetical protein
VDRAQDNDREIAMPIDRTFPPNESSPKASSPLMADFGEPEVAMSERAAVLAPTQAKRRTDRRERHPGGAAGL